MKCIENKANSTEACSSWLSVIYSLLAMGNMTWMAVKHAIARLVEYTLVAQHAYLLLTKTKSMPTVPSPRGDFGGLSTAKQSTKPRQTETWSTIHQWSFYQFFNVKPPCTNANPPYWRLSGNSSACRMPHWKQVISYTSEIYLASCGVLFLSAQLCCFS